MTPSNLIDEPTADAVDAPDALSAAVNRWINRSQAEKLADRQEVMKTARLGRALPEGKSFFEVVQGTWPGDETDERISEALARLS